MSQANDGGERGKLEVFVGHSEDAADEARAILELEPDLRRDFEALGELGGAACPFTGFAMWEWVADATSRPGGQHQAVTPTLRRAQIAVFVFKERVGVVTWMELEEFRTRAAVDRVHVIPLFPVNPPPAERFVDVAFAKGWAELLEKRDELSRDWTAEQSRSVTPQPGYQDRGHLKQLAREKIRRAIEDLVRNCPVPPVAAAPDVTAFIEPGSGGLSFDQRRVLRYGLGDLDRELIDHFLKQPLSAAPVRQMGRLVRLSRTDRLAHFGCLRDGHPTVGAFLCFAPAPLLAGAFASSSLHMVQYQGTTRESRVQIRPLSDNLLNLFEEGLAWLTTQAGLRRTGTVGTQERDELEVPEIVLREALANALVHRDYGKAVFRDQPTRIEVFDDRVEITSFGGLPSLISVEQLNDPPEDLKPVRRNPVVARIFVHMAYAELNASGIIRMHNAMEAAALPPPEVIHERQQGIVIVRLRRPRRVESVVRADARPMLLLIDDDIADREGTAKWLDHAGFDVITTSDLRDARQILRSSGEAVRLAIIDINPASASSDTREVLQGLKELRTPTIFLSSYKEPGEEIRKALRDTEFSITALPRLETGQRTLLREIRRLLVPRVFILHDGAQHAVDPVTDWVLRQGLRAVRLDHLSARGDTAVEKLEREARRAEFALVIIANAVFNPGVGQPVPRPNVIFELGMLTQILGRERVLVLYDPDVDIRSDYMQVESVELDDAGRWKDGVSRAMVQAGIDLELHRQSAR